MGWKNYLKTKQGSGEKPWGYKRWSQNYEHLKKHSIHPWLSAIVTNRGRDIYKNIKNLFVTLSGTQFVKTFGDNFVKPKNAKETERLFDAMQDIVDNGKKDGNNYQRRRLLVKTGEEYHYSALWADFVEYVEVGEKQYHVCSSGQDILSQVNVDSNGAFEFSCRRSPRLCKCIYAIGTGFVGDQVFFADDLELIVFRTDDGYAAYEIKEGDEYIDYGDVNDGRRDRRRRRLLQTGHRGGS